jgi:HTH-type transcriptional regulator/antitoxin HigA
MSSNNQERPAESFHPGVYIRDEIEARDWSQLDLAEILGRPPRLVNELIGGIRAVSPETAKGLSEAFGTSAEIWMNLQSAYDLWRSQESSDEVSRRARLYSIAPIRDMIKRGWIEGSDSIGVVEQNVSDFLEISSVKQEPELAVAARTPLEAPTISQRAWFFRAKKLGGVVQAQRFTEKRLKECMKNLRPLMSAPEEARHVPAILAAAGIRFVVVEPLKKSRIDGATIWLNKQSPVIALSMRYDRIDWFWHTLIHEIQHVRRRDNVFDLDISEHKDDEQELEADSAAREFLVPSDDLNDFISRVSPLYSQRSIRAFAAKLGVHPGIVVGQLQFRDEISYAHSRALLVKIRDCVIHSSITDGWGSMLPSGI